MGCNRKGPWAPQLPPRNMYQYNGKELNEDLNLNWSDYGARWYQASIGCFHVIDPKFEEYYEWSPYNYTGNNPILRIDINGEGWGLLVKAGRALLKTGKRVYKSYKKSGKLDLKKNTAETIKETFDNVSTLVDGKLDSEDVFAAIDLATGFGGEAKKLMKQIRIYICLVMLHDQNLLGKE
ncbi:MAG: RHS repeat domain-containing protein [Saprospiraceae bacterium]